MPFDIGKGFAGLRKAYAAHTPENSPPSSPNKAAGRSVVDKSRYGSGHDNKGEGKDHDYGDLDIDAQNASDGSLRMDDDLEAEVDPEVMRRMSAVEEGLLELLRKNGNLPDDDDDEDEVSGGNLDAVKEEPSESSAISVISEISAGGTRRMIEHQRHAFPCRDTFSELPANPDKWPQAPVMIRPTPHTSTKIRGIRKAASKEYQHFKGFCAGCILPINTGTEAPGESLVVDFESPHFIGTLLMRIQQAPPTALVEHDPDEKNGYFHGKKRKFQAIVKGRFKTPLPMSECITGQSFSRPAGKLPARWIVASFVKFVSSLAPQLEATIDGDMPRFLTPLVATAHTVLAKPIKQDNGVGTAEEKYNYDATDLEIGVSEPGSLEETSVLPDIQRDLGVSIPNTAKSSVPARMKARKKAFNSVAANNEKDPRFSLDKEYTFEFYQHLLDFGKDLAVDMGRPIGRVGLASATNGQPLKFMSAHKDPENGKLDSLWSFDIWHSSLYAIAEKSMGPHQH